MSRGKKISGPVQPAKSSASVGRFLLIFSLLLAAYYVIILLPWCDEALYVYLRANAWLSQLVLRGLGQATELNGVTIRSASFAISIRRGCDAIEPAWFFCAAVLAFPVAWKRKRFALVAGTTTILLLNLLRIVSLYFIGRFQPAFFAAAHLEWWPAVFILSAAGLWLWWIRPSAEPIVDVPDAQL